MSLENSARKLIQIKKELDRLEDQYEKARIDVHNDLVNSGKSLIELDGYRISHQEETVSMQFKLDMLKEVLAKRGINGKDIDEIIYDSRVEVERSGLVRIIKLNSNQINVI